MIEEHNRTPDSPVVTPSEQVVFTAFDDGEGVLVDLSTKKYFRLNQTGMFVWGRIEKGMNPVDIASEMTDVYEITAEGAAESVQKFLGSLRSLKLVASRS